MSNFSLDQFLEACGAAGPLHLTVDRGGATDNYVLPQPFALIGSDPRADLHVSDSRIPRQAAFLQVLGGRLLALDLTPDAAGRNGSYPPHHWLSPGQPWQFGGLTIRLAANPPNDADTKALSRRDELPAAALEITGGSRGVCEYSFKAPIVLIGKSPKCQVRLRDPAVSRFHCALIHTPAGLWAVDLLGRAGITVNGRVARAARMEDGDELRIGGFALRSRRPIGPSVHASLAEQLVHLPSPQPATTDWLATLPDALGANAGASLGPVVSVLVALQQQMAEQHRLTMTSMFDAFRRMQNDQMQMILGEFAQIRRLTEEVTSLKATMAQLPMAASPVRPVPAAPSVPVEKPAPGPCPPAERPAARPVPVDSRSHFRRRQRENGSSHGRRSCLVEPARGGRSKRNGKGGGKRLSVSWRGRRNKRIVYRCTATVGVAHWPISPPEPERRQTFPLITLMPRTVGAGIHTATRLIVEVNSNRPRLCGTVSDPIPAWSPPGFADWAPRLDLAGLRVAD